MPEPEFYLEEGGGPRPEDLEVYQHKGGGPRCPNASFLQWKGGGHAPMIPRLFSSDGKPAARPRPNNEQGEGYGPTLLAPIYRGKAAARPCSRKRGGLRAHTLIVLIGKASFPALSLIVNYH